MPDHGFEPLSDAGGGAARHAPRQRSRPDLIYALRNSLLHGYGVPKPSRTHGRTVLLTSDPSRYAVDTSKRGQALVSMPVFCGHLFERIVAEAYDQWDVTLLDTDVKL
jgi:hypothetical protein